MSDRSTPPRQSGSAYGPSPAAMSEALERIDMWTDGDYFEHQIRDVVEAAHDPALGIDASVSRRAVYDWADPEPYSNGDTDWHAGYGQALIDLREWLLNGR